MPTLRCPQHHTMTATLDEIAEGLRCAQCGQNMRMEHIVPDAPRSRRPTSQPAGEEDVSERGGIADIGGSEEDE